MLDSILVESSGATMGVTKEGVPTRASEKEEKGGAAWGKRGMV
jgi:hypothetical protein